MEPIRSKLLTAVKMSVVVAKACTPPLLYNAARHAYFGFRRNVSPEFSLPIATIAELFPNSIHKPVQMLPAQLRDHLWGMPENELLVLGAIAAASAPQRIVEFGTFTGASTLALALNSEASARIITVDIDPGKRETHVHGLGTGLLSFDVGKLFAGTLWKTKIEQKFLDTREFEFKHWDGSVDLFFVDADHTYEFVKHDSETAKRMLARRGIIVWHDYRWEPQDKECAGVTQAVNEFHEVYGNCFQIEGTRFAIFASEK